MNKFLVILLIGCSVSAAAQLKIKEAQIISKVDNKPFDSGDSIIIDEKGDWKKKAELVVTDLSGDKKYEKIEIQYTSAAGLGQKAPGNLVDKEYKFDLADIIEPAGGLFHVLYEGKAMGDIQFKMRTIQATGKNPNPTSFFNLQQEATNYIKTNFVPRLTEDKRTNTYKKGNTIYLFVDADGNYLLKGPPSIAFRKNKYKVILIKRSSDDYQYRLLDPRVILTDQLVIDAPATISGVAMGNASSSTGKNDLAIIEFGEISPSENSFPIVVVRSKVDKSEEIVRTTINVAKEYHVSIQAGLLMTTLRNPENITLATLDNGETTLTADDPHTRGIFTVMAVYYPWGRSMIFPPSGPLFSKQRFGVVLGVRADQDQFRNFLGGLQFDFARGGSFSFGAHYGRRAVIADKKNFKFGEEVFSGTLENKIKQEWNVGFFLGANIDIRIFNFLFGGAFAGSENDD